MIKNKNLLAVLLLAVTLAIGCQSLGGNKTAETIETALKDPKSSVSYQFEALKAGEFEKLKSCFTDRLRDRVIKEDVEKAKTKLSEAKMTLDDLYQSVEMGEYQGKKTAKVKMKNGRTLTTLVETDGKWLSDTIWYQ